MLNYLLTLEKFKSKILNVKSKSGSISSMSADAARSIQRELNELLDKNIDINKLEEI
jgi:hypothetical protein